MSTTVFCRKYQKELDALTQPPMPGPKGEELMKTVSQAAWQAWLEHQTRLINEKHLKVFEPQTRQYLLEQMDKFFDNQETDQAEGYVPPENS